VCLFLDYSDSLVIQFVVSPGSNPTATDAVGLMKQQVNNGTFFLTVSNYTSVPPAEMYAWTG